MSTKSRGAAAEGIEEPVAVSDDADHQQSDHEHERGPGLLSRGPGVVWRDDDRGSNGGCADQGEKLLKRDWSQVVCATT